MSATRPPKLVFVGCNNGCGQMGLGHKNENSLINKMRIMKIFGLLLLIIVHGQFGVGKGIDSDVKLLKLNYLQQNKIKLKKNLCIVSHKLNMFYY